VWNQSPAQLAKPKPFPPSGHDRRQLAGSDIVARSIFAEDDARHLKLLDEVVE
jgi:hypothetical protein